MLEIRDHTRCENQRVKKLLIGKKNVVCVMLRALFPQYCVRLPDSFIPLKCWPVSYLLIQFASRQHHYTSVSRLLAIFYLKMARGD